MRGWVAVAVNWTLDPFLAIAFFRSLAHRLGELLMGVIAL